MKQRQSQTSSTNQKNIKPRLRWITMFSFLSMVSQLVWAEDPPDTTPPPSSSPLITSKDWTLNKITSPAYPDSLCIASTKTTMDNINYFFEIIVDPNNKIPSEIQLATDSPSTETGFKLSLASLKKTPLSLVSLKTTETTSHFWYVPGNSSALFSALKRDLRIDATGFSATTKPLIFSLRGSTKVLSTLEEKCSPKRPLFSDDFEKQVLKNLAFDLTTHSLDNEHANKLKALISDAQIAFFENANLGKDLTKLAKQYAKQLNEYASINKDIDHLTKIELAQTVEKQSQSLAKVAQLQNEIAQIEQLTKDKEAEKAIANADYEKAYNAFNPLVPEHKRLLGLLNSQISKKNQEQAELNSLDNQIEFTKNEIINLKREIENLNQQIQQDNSTIEYARRRHAEAESALRAFDYNYEVRRAVDYDSTMNDLNRREDSTQSELQQAQHRKEEAAQRHRHAERALEQCRAGQNQPPIGEIHRPPGRGNPQPPPAVNNPPPAPDCSRQQRDLEEADHQRRRAHRDIEDLHQRLDSIRQEKNYRLRQIENSVAARRQDLIDREAHTNQELAAALSEWNQHSSRLNQIATYELPQQQQELDRLQSRRANTYRALVDAKSAVNKADAELKAYDERVNFAPLKKAFENEIQRAEKIKAELKKFDSDIKSKQESIKTQEKAQVLLQKQIEAITQKISKNQSRSDELDQILKPYNEAKAPLEERIKTNDEKIGLAKNEVEQILK